MQCQLSKKRSNLGNLLRPWLKELLCFQISIVFIAEKLALVIVTFSLITVASIKANDKNSAILFIYILLLFKQILYIYHPIWFHNKNQAKVQTLIDFDTERLILRP